MTALFIVIAFTPANADVWTPPTRVEPQNYFSMIRQADFRYSSHIEAHIPKDGRLMGITCPGPTDSGDCSSDTLFAYVHMPACSLVDEINCIEGATVENLKTKSSAQLEHVSAARGDEFASNGESGLTRLSSISTWKSKSEVASTSTDYAVNVYLTAEYKKSSNTWTYKTLNAQISPIRKVELGGSNCWFFMVLPSTACGLQMNFADDTAASLTLRLSKDIGGWFHGRVVDPQITISAAKNPKAQTIKVYGATAKVPMIYAMIKKAEATPAQKALDPDMSGEYVAGMNYLGNDPRAFLMIDAYKDVAKDQAVATTQVWSFGSVLINSGQKFGANCFLDTSRILGIVSTNAPVYDSGVPTFTGSSLNYRVSSMHYLPDGITPVTGNYNFVMRSDVARCLWEFSKAPISATIQVRSTSGENQLAVTSYLEKDGWFKLSATNFTFSSPTIQAKLSQKKLTLVCVSKKNNRLTKKVIGYSPVCPSGYKKK
jgi:hypothetical protein